MFRSSIVCFKGQRDCPNRHEEAINHQLHGGHCVSLICQSMPYIANGRTQHIPGAPQQMPSDATPTVLQNRSCDWLLHI